jgi:23S rRNA (adenine1618-N6)-methyltransferase
MTKEQILHPRNIHNDKYNFDQLTLAYPKLATFVSKNQYGDLSINFSDGNAVLALNQALLLHHYKVTDWTIPKGHLCPAIPGRADYLHHIADLLGESTEAGPAVGTKIKGLDIGTGTSCIYPILGNSIYGWKFVGSDISTHAINHAKSILNANKALKKNIKVRFQKSADNIFINIIKPDEKFDFTMCNPPFFASLSEANHASDRKVKNLNINKEKKGHAPIKIKNDGHSNFGGKKAELWCPGGELEFTKKMIQESVKVKTQCRWFTTLVSKSEYLKDFQHQLKNLKCAEVRTIKMHLGQKISHILIWRF